MKLDNIRLGIYDYIETEIVGKAQGVQKFFMCTMVSLYSGKINSTLETYAEQIKKIGIMNEQGEIDVNVLHNAMKQGIQKSGSFQWNGMIFDDKDVEKIFFYINKRG